jgi:recombinational DNA repair protein RecR
MSLLSEIASEGDLRRRRKTDILKTALTDKEYKELVTALTEGKYTLAAITRVLNKRGIRISRFALEDMRDRLRSGEEA